MSIVKCGANPLEHKVDEVGGKGHNLLRLYNSQHKGTLFEVPQFFVLPTKAIGGFLNTSEGEFAVFNDEVAVKQAYDSLRNPVIVRSSSPLEDGVNATFAGMFATIGNVNSYKQFTAACRDVSHSAYRGRVEEYATKVGISLESTGAMAQIVQEQVTNPTLAGIIQLESDRAFVEGVNHGQRFSHEIEYSFLKDSFLKELGPIPSWSTFTNPDFVVEGAYYNLVCSAQEVSKELGLEGVVQVEFCYTPGKIPAFVQIRRLPKMKSLPAELDLTIPEGVQHIESAVCNGVAGELTLPAYVTFSQAGFKMFLIEVGHGGVVSREWPPKKDSRTEAFKTSKLSRNYDYKKFRQSEMMSHLDPYDFSTYEACWEFGNNLFPDGHILVCDKLDQSVVGMDDLTSNKKAIITTKENDRTSHAITRARELGIMCMSIQTDMTRMNQFYHQVETGDLIHMKSDGRRAVAYIEKRRDKDPYSS